jgi:putative acetyltransferase
MSNRLAVTIREVRPGDFPAINALHNQRSVAAGTLQIPFTTDAERQERWQPGPGLRFIVAEAEGRIVGAAGLHPFQRRQAHVGSLGMAVDEAYQGRGVGRALMAALVDLADNWYNLRRLQLEVYTDNEPAIRLYQRFGFVIEGTHRAFAYRLGEFVDAYSMARLRNEPPVDRGTPATPPPAPARA